MSAPQASSSPWHGRVRPVLEQAGVDAEARGAMITVMREANEDPGGFLVHSPYAVHELRA
jgi:hypothetical protein